MATNGKKKTEKEKFYLTTPIYYPSGKWHLGHCYTTVYGDAIARFKRMEGYDVFYLTGTDEHGQKIEKRAESAGVSPKKFVDGLVGEIKELWGALNVSYTKFIRTTDDYHVKAVQNIFKKLYDKGDIYKSKYKGKYCTPCEAFWTESQLVDGKCPDCGREVQETEEESYFFKLSKYAPQVRKLLTETDFLQPESRVNEMVNNFIDAGLEDVAVSRTSFTWGVPVEFDKGHIVYVWIDALSNYITALGYNGESESADMNRFWPADLHLMAKEIVRFHSIIWPAMLMALDLPLPKKVVGHGWLLFGGDKMSKSKGNVVDPFILKERYGADALRYYLLRAMPFGSDGAYTSEALLTRINSELCNDLGNLVRRTMKMNEQYFAGKLSKGAESADDAAIIAKANALYGAVKADMDAYRPQQALEKIFDLVGMANKYIDLTKPWALVKENNTERLNQVLYVLTESIRIIGVLLLPFVPETGEKILASLKLTPPKTNEGLSYGAVKTYNTVALDALFPRLNVEKELEELEKLASGKKDEKESVKKEEKKEENKQVSEQDNNYITIDEFFRTQLKVAEVLACEKVEKADKLLKLTVKVGEEERTVVSGIAKYYTPEEMVGKRVVLVCNLKPRNMRGIISEGMILCASEGDKLTLVTPETAIGSGAEVC
ncbi:methionine--tRNA ligase [Pumilibacter muris]|uniref:methionine--tRNA ligase n=1 Tax=Pumilibacter muris TaxID=2941510 RepID=UPI00203E0EC4|nr:methionine--tRNA ligase [Pumilibacter muris]